MRANTVRPASAWINPVVAAAVVTAVVLGVIGVGAITGVIPGLLPEMRYDAPPTGAAREPGGGPVEASKCPLCGTVESIRTVELRGEAGAVSADGLAGSAAGNASAREEGTPARTILGTGGEAGARSEIEKSVKKRLAYRVTVRMDDGSYRTVSQSSPPALAVGDKVRVVEGRLVRA